MLIQWCNLQIQGIEATSHLHLCCVKQHSPEKRFADAQMNIFAEGVRTEGMVARQCPIHSILSSAFDRKRTPEKRDLDLGALGLRESYDTSSSSSSMKVRN